MIGFAIQAVLALLVCYLLGSILFGLIISESAYGVDIRRFGSGNVGFTNIKRVLGWKPAVAVLFLDAAKGMLAVWISRRVFVDHAGRWDQVLVLMGGILAILGHNWSIFSRFAGGKGVATSLGVLFALDWKVALLALAVGTPLLYWPGYMSLASTVGTASVPLWFWMLDDPMPYRLFGIMVFIFVFVRHLPNWRRIADHVEPRFTLRGRTDGPDLVSAPPMADVADEKDKQKRGAPG